MLNYSLINSNPIQLAFSLFHFSKTTLLQLGVSLLEEDTPSTLGDTTINKSTSQIVMPTIVNRGEWFGSSANIKGANKDAKI